MSEEEELITPQEEAEEPQPERPPMKVALIVAMGRNHEIGRNNNLLWHLTEDMRFFKETTLKHFVITGRKNFESIPQKFRPLPERVNVIVSHNADYMYEECYTCTTLEEALTLPKENGEDRAYIIGGGQIYRLAMDAGIVDEMYITHVEAEFADADTFFPQFNEADWDKTFIYEAFADSQNEFAFKTYKYERKSKTQSAD
ncbi:MAG: dihydrofolate reductase [Flavobacteriales bacterium]